MATAVRPLVHVEAYSSQPGRELRPQAALDLLGVARPDVGSVLLLEQPLLGEPMFIRTFSLTFVLVFSTLNL